MSSYALQAKALLEKRKRQGIKVEESQLDQPPPVLTLHEYIPDAWPVLEPTTVYVPNWHIDATAEHLEAVTNGIIRNLIINIPPRHMKSLLVCVFWMTWSWTIDPSLRWLFSSYSDKLSMRDSLKCRTLIRSNWYQSNWGSVFTLLPDQNQKTRFENDKTGLRLATSVGGMATGEGGDIIVADDAHKVDQVESDKVRKGVLNWWDKTMATRLNDPKTGAKVIIMQRLHENDLTGHVMERMEKEEGADQYETLILPAEWDGQRRYTVIGFEDPRTEPKELLYPQRFDKEVLSSLKSSLGEYGASGQLQQSPAPVGGGIFKRHSWKFWYPASMPVPMPITTKLEDGGLVVHEQRPLPVLDEHAQSWDMSFKDNPENDFVCGQVWGKYRALFFLLFQLKRRMDLPQTIAALSAVSTSWPQATLKLVEDKANGPAVIQTLRSSVPGLVAFSPVGDKESRARAVSPFTESGNVYLPHPTVYPWVNELINTAAKFPKVSYDDEIDAMTQMLIRWTRGMVPTDDRNAVNNYMQAQLENGRSKQLRRSNGSGQRFGDDYSSHVAGGRGFKTNRYRRIRRPI